MGGPENRTPDVLNKVQKFKGHVYENVTWSQDGMSLEVYVRPRERSPQPVQNAAAKGAVYDHEIARKKGHKYLTLVYHTNDEARGVLFVAQERTKESIDRFFRILKADNCKAKLTMKKACGFKSYNVAEVALLHTPGKLPTPQVTHRFW